MAEYYVNNFATGGALNGADWANAFTDLKTAMEAPRVAGDIFYVAHDHTQVNGGAFTITSPGVDNNPQKVYCVNRFGSVPPVEADLRDPSMGGVGALIGGNPLSIAGTVVWYGTKIQSGTGSLTLGSASRTQRFIKSQFNLAHATSTGRIVLGNGTGSMTILEDCIFSFGHLGQGINPAGRLLIRGGSILPASTNANSFLITSATSSFVLVEGMDLTKITSALVNNTGTAATQIVFKDCKLAAATQMVSGMPASPGAVDVMMVRCHSGDGNYRLERVNMQGGQITSPAIVRLGGATDGEQPISYQMFSQFSNMFEFPYESLPISVWNDVVGTPITVTIEGNYTAGGGALPPNDLIWMDIEYLGTAGFPIGSKVSNGKAIMGAAAANHEASSSLWSVGGLTPFKMSLTVTPQERGPITVYLKCARTNGFFYIDPKPIVALAA